jgi:ribosomal protein S18 acetylase RimI-like enzyme
VTLVELDDRALIAAFCRRRPAVHAYELGDLDDFFWPHTRWFGWKQGDSLLQLSLLYTENELPVLLAFSEEPLQSMELLLAELLPSLPRRVYAHLTPSLLDTVGSRYGVSMEGRHLKMGLARHDLLFEVDEATVLAAADLAEVEAFYAEAYPSTWFVPRMLESGRYVGLLEDDRLVCVAGVHVWSQAWRVAALGNVATLPSHRRRGLAQAACSHLCRLLLDDGIDTIALNVRADNAPAIAAYTMLGFEPVAQYEEALLEESRG